ncbi:MULTISPECIES: DUF5018-related domain-containing protein [Zobellia]|uniref:DUF5018-related domain-containing protein n=1 Tax=Zobellia TaxID=112040 RepID=UPI001BFEF77B|nr:MULTISPECIES: hypothetical protein [Zobellia]MBT9188142.1 hypothetical protein [Zobellia russellii]MBU2974434.1 hypothetical protein [Zobellia sp. B3R18]MDO6818516.1 hypothetical protein [Zobellia sp. 1_MG-2023]
MKNITYLLFLLVGITMTSCLKSDLEELPTFNEAEITNFRFEYRWIDDTQDFNRLQVVQLNVETTIDTVNQKVACAITVPPANGDFPEEVRSQVSLSEIVGYADISTAATLAPANGAPALGEIGDFSTNPISYEVTAADGTKLTWGLTITEFNK